MKTMILTKTMILSTVIAFLIVAPVHASPLTWLFSGTTSSSSQFNGMSIGTTQFELQIFVDTDLVGMKFAGLADVFFGGPHQGVVALATLGVLPVNPFPNVQYFAPGGVVTGVQYIEILAGFSGIQFSSPISTDSLHLSPIAATMPKAPFDTVSFSGPNGLVVSGHVTTFSAELVPEAGSTALLLTLGLVALGFLRRRYKGSDS